jgi:hypothetical protein
VVLPSLKLRLQNKGSLLIDAERYCLLLPDPDTLDEIKDFAISYVWEKGKDSETALKTETTNLYLLREGNALHPESVPSSLSPETVKDATPGDRGALGEVFMCRSFLYYLGCRFEMKMED